MDIDSLWVQYSKTKDRDIRNMLIEEYTGLVQIVAGRMYNYFGSKVEYDDLIGYGILGLIDSIDKFDLSKNIKFETYAQFRIKGEIIDNIRRLDWIPRSLRKKSRDLQDSIYRLENELGREPTNEEIAENMNISLGDLEELLSDMATFNMSSLEELISINGDFLTGSSSADSSPEESYSNKEMKSLMKAAIESLAENEQMVISLYYYEDLTYKEIAYIMDLSESRISQIHSKAILKMKNNLYSRGIKEGY